MENFNYIKKHKSVRLSSFSSRKSLSAHSYRTIFHINQNLIPLKTFLEENKKGYEPGSDSYIKFSNNIFIRITDLSDNNFLFAPTNSTLKIIPPSSNKSIIEKGDICYQTASNVGNVCFYNGEKAYFNSHIRKLIFKDKKYYLFCILKSNFGRNQVDVGGSIKGVDNFSDELLLNTLIPFPTHKNHNTPEIIEEYISMLTQNILNKEEHIYHKQKAINQIIENELSICENSFQYKHPHLNELFCNQNRLDTGLYTREYKLIIHNIKKYKKGYFLLDSLKKQWISGSTPNPIIQTNLLESTLWIAVADLNYGMTYKRLNSFKLKDKFNSIKDGDILITRKGATVGKLIIYFRTKYKDAFVNEDIKVLRLSTNIQDQIFIGLFLNSKFGQTQLLSNGSKGTKQGLTNSNISNVLIPNFDPTLKSQLALLYYNPLPHNENLTLDNYLEIEKDRNLELGIYNLNLECFELRNKLDAIIDKIIKEEPITIEL